MVSPGKLCLELPGVAKPFVKVAFAETIVLRASSIDNLTVQWGVQDHYEIVRKVGRGKYSEVSSSSASDARNPFHG